MWPYTEEENELLSNTQKPKLDEIDPMDWVEIYGHENFNKVFKK